MTDIARRKVDWLDSENDRICVATAMRQWEASLKRPDLAEKDRVRGAIEAYTRQAIALTALASVPAPSGAELVAWRWQDGERWVFETTPPNPEGEGCKVEPLYAAPQAVPAEDIAGLIERLANASNEIEEAKITFERGGLSWCWFYDLVNDCSAALTSLCAELAEANLDRCFATEDDPACKLESEFNKIAEKERARATASEAEATSLRRKLEETTRERDQAQGIIKGREALAAGLGINADKIAVHIAQDFARKAKEAESRAEAAERKLEERERIGKMMANAAYNIHQRAAGIHVGFGLDDAIRSLKSVQEEWDRSLSGASE